MRFLLLFLALIVPTPAHAAERMLTLTSFDTVRVEGPFAVQVTTGRGSGGRISGATAALEGVSVAVEGRTAIVRAGGSVWGERSGADGGPVLVTLTTGELTDVQVIGAGSVTVDRIKGSRARLVVDGAGTIDVGTLAVDRLDAAAAGAGLLRLAGNVLEGSVLLRGNGSVDAAGLLIRDAQLANEGSGAMAVTATRTATVALAGTGKITVFGQAACTVSNMGAGSVICRNARLASAN